MWRAGPGAAVSAESQPSGKGLCQGLPQFYVRLHLQQLPRAVQQTVPAHRRGKSRARGTATPPHPVPL